MGPTFRAVQLTFCQQLIYPFVGSRNVSTPSTQAKQDSEMIVEGFNLSCHMYYVRYPCLILISHNAASFYEKDTA